jgi:nucleoside-diphosphate-sugar epimerase
MGEEQETGPADYDVFSEELISLINKDLVLSEEFRPSQSQVKEPTIKRSQIKSILLTGVTGKFGPFMLRSILTKTGVNKVVCLIRSKARENGLARLRAALEGLDLLKDIDMTKVEVLNADMTEKHFGLTQSDWETLAEKVDAVVHCAVKGNLMDPYTRFKDGAISTRGTDIRTVNVLGKL